jgi:hypothetical protein
MFGQPRVLDKAYLVQALTTISSKGLFNSFADTNLRARKLHLRQERQTYLWRRQQGISTQNKLIALLKKLRKHCPSMD